MTAKKYCQNFRSAFPISCGIPSSMSLTILMVTNNYTPYKGGVVASIQTSAQALRAHGHRVIIATLSFTPDDAEELDVIRIPAYLHFRYKQNPCSIPCKAYATLENIIRMYRPDIIHSHHPFLLGKYAAQLSKRYRIPLVFTHHTQYEQYAHYIPIPISLTQQIIHRLLQEYYTQVHQIIMPSKSITQEICPKKYTIIPSCIRDSFIHHKKPYKQITTISELITVSRFVPEKNIPFLLKTYRLLPEKKYRFTLYGFGHALRTLQDLAYCTYNLDPQFCIFKEHPTHEELVRAYAQAHLFLFASQTETQGLVLAESLAAGTPVVALAAPGANDAIIPGYNGFLGANEKQLAQYIEQITSNSLLYEQLSQNAWLSAHRYYPQTHGEQLLRVYNQVILKFLNCQGSS